MASDLALNGEVVRKQEALLVEARKKPLGDEHSETLGSIHAL